MKNRKSFSSLVLLLVLVIVFYVRNVKNETPNTKFTVDDVAEKEMSMVQNASFEGNDSISSKQNAAFDFLPTSTTRQIITHDNYTLSYVENFEQAEWVAYELRNNYSGNHYKRPSFIEDPKVATHSAASKNYKKSGYDRGHLCAAADMRFSKSAYDDTFFTSNISPQLHSFNDGIWKRLEEKTRYWAVKYDGVYVVTGGVLKGGLKTIGKEHVAVPDYFYKILMERSREEYRMIAFLVPNKASIRPLYSFVVSVDEVEKMTGIDFFPKLVDKIETQLEKSSDYKKWSF
jgi:endonuclease G